MLAVLAAGFPVPEGAVSLHPAAEHGLSSPPRECSLHEPLRPSDRLFLSQCWSF